MALLELDDIQSGVLRPRPTPFAATYIILRIDDRAAGRALMRRLSEIVASAAHPESPARDTWVSASLTFAGLKSLGVSQASLDSFSPQFRARHGGARATVARRRGERSRTLGEAARHGRRARRADGNFDGCGAAGRGDRPGARGVSERSRNHADLASGLPRSSQRDRAVRFQGRHQPSGDRRQRHSGTNPHEVPLKPGEFVLGYPDEYGGVAAVPQPEILGRNGSYVAFRKLHQRVAAFRRYLKANASRCR